MTQFCMPTTSFSFSYATKITVRNVPFGLTFIPHLIPNVIQLPLKVTSLFHSVLCNGRPLIAISQCGEGREGEHVYLCVCTCLSSDSLCSTHPTGWLEEWFMGLTDAWCSWICPWSSQKPGQHCHSPLPKLSLYWLQNPLWQRCNG